MKQCVPVRALRHQAGEIVRIHITAAVATALALCLLGQWPAASATRGSVVVKPTAAPGPLDNPLKGWATYINAGPIHQPYSMVTFYVSWKELEPEEGEYRFAEWEREWWTRSEARGKRVIIRPYIDYPNSASGIPKWLTDKGVKVTQYDIPNFGKGTSPDYDDPRLLLSLEKLIAEMGKRYDTDPRVAFLNLGMLGFWGEWHTYPRIEMFASPATEKRVIDAYRKAFPNKLLHARYPRDYAGKQKWLGYNDDSFPGGTDGPEEWKFLTMMRKSGRSDAWRTRPIGGEMIPFEGPKWLGSDFEHTMKMVEDGHWTWVGPYSPALDKPGPELIANCEKMVRRMGYEFRLLEIRHRSPVRRTADFEIYIEGMNQGVAPFYYAWPVKLALIDDQDRVVATDQLRVDIRKWLPGRFIVNESVSFTVPAGSYRLAAGILDPLTDKPAVGFANELERVNGWWVVSRITLE